MKLSDRQFLAVVIIGTLALCLLFFRLYASVAPITERFIQ